MVALTKRYLLDHVRKDRRVNRAYVAGMKPALGNMQYISTSGLTNQGSRELSQKELLMAASYGSGIYSISGSGTPTSGIFQGYNLSGGALTPYGYGMSGRGLKQFINKIGHSKFVKYISGIAKPLSKLISPALKVTTMGSSLGGEMGKGLNTVAGAPSVSMAESQYLSNLGKKQADRRKDGEFANRVVLDTHQLNILDSLIIGKEPSMKYKRNGKPSVSGRTKKKGVKGGGIAYV